MGAVAGSALCPASTPAAVGRPVPVDLSGAPVTFRALQVLALVVGVGLAALSTRTGTIATARAAAESVPDGFGARPSDRCLVLRVC